MELREQKYVLAIVQCRNISQAAEQLHVSQPALSAFLLKLEREIGSPLFERHGRELKITRIGELYAQKAARIMDIEREFQQELSALLKDRRVPLKIGVQTMRAPKLVPRLLIGFRRHFPSAEPEFVEDFAGALLCRLRRRELDAVMCNCIAESDVFTDVERVTLRSDQLLLVAPKDCEAVAACAAPSAGYPIIRLADVLDQKFILLPKTHSIRRLVDRHLREQGISLLNAGEANRQEWAVNLAALGEGVTFTLDSYVSYFRPPRPAAFYQVDGAPQTSIDLMYLRKHLDETSRKALTAIGREAFADNNL